MGAAECRADARYSIPRGCAKHEYAVFPECADPSRDELGTDAAHDTARDGQRARGGNSGSIQRANGHAASRGVNRGINRRAFRGYGGSSDSRLLRQNETAQNEANQIEKATKTWVNS